MTTLNLTFTQAVALRDFLYTADVSQTVLGRPSPQELERYLRPVVADLDSKIEDEVETLSCAL